MTVRPLELDELSTLRRELEARLEERLAPPRASADPAEVQRSVAKLVLTLVEFIRELMERQAIRRMEAGTLTDDQTEAMGQALMQIEDTVREMAARFGLDPAELNLDLGPLGRLR